MQQLQQVQMPQKLCGRTHSCPLPNVCCSTLITLPALLTRTRLLVATLPASVYLCFIPVHPHPSGPV